MLEKDGVLITYYFDFIYAAVRADQEIVGVSVVAINVTDQVLSEQKLQESELRFKGLTEISDYSKNIDFMFLLFSVGSSRWHFFIFLSEQ